MELVEIILPTYNGEKFIKQQIESILDQSYSNIKIYIRDDGSSDSTTRIINELYKIDNRITLYDDALGNLGIVKNVEYLLNKTHSNYIMFSDQDDVWFPNKVGLMLSAMLDYERIYGENIPLLIHSDCFVTNMDLKIIGKLKGNAPFKYGLVNSLFKYHVQGASSMINRSLVKEILPFIDKVYLHDRYMHLITEVKGKRFYISTPLMYYRQHSNNLVGSNSFFEKVILNMTRRSLTYYIHEDRDLIYSLYNSKFQDNFLLKIYLIITSHKVNRIKKLKLIYSNRISLRMKELFLLIIKN